MSKRGLLEMNRNVMSSTSRRIVKGSVGAYGPRKRWRERKKNARLRSALETLGGTGSRR